MTYPEKADMYAVRYLGVVSSLSESQDLQGNLRRAEILQFGWLGVEELACLCLLAKRLSPEL